MNQNVKNIVREEFWRGAVWLLVGIVGWSVILTETESLPTNAPTAVGLPIATAIVGIVGMTAIRIATGRELKGDAASKLLIGFLSDAVIGFYLIWRFLSGTWTTMESVLAVIVLLSPVGYAVYLRETDE